MADGHEMDVPQLGLRPTHGHNGATTGRPMRVFEPGELNELFEDGGPSALREVPADAQ